MKPFTAIVFLSFALLVRAGTLDSTTRKKEAPMKMDPVVVKGDSLLSFGFAIRVTRIAEPRSVVSMVIERVQPGSDADIKGLKPESRILSINDKPASDYDATFNPGSELSRIFVGRTEGASVVLEVISPGKQKSKKMKIYRRTVPYNPPEISVPFFHAHS